MASRKSQTADAPVNEATAETAVDTATDARRGRPRPQLTLERDKLVAEKMGEYALDQEWTKNEVAEATGLDVSTVYHCLNRLTWSRNVEKVGRGKFRRTATADGQPTPYSSEYVDKPEKKVAAAAQA